jgi:ATP diphosphatase
MNTKKKENFSNIFDDIPQGMTELGRAEKIQKIVSALGFDWSLPEETLHKIQEEYEETKQSILNKESKEKITEEIGDLFFAVVNLTRHLQIDPGEAIDLANKKFCRRFTLVQSYAENDGTTVSDCNLDQLDFYWKQAKQEELS